MKSRHLPSIIVLTLLSSCYNTLNEEYIDTDNPNTPKVSIIKIGDKASLKFDSQDSFLHHLNLVKEGIVLDLTDATRSTDLEFISLKDELRSKHDIILTEQDYSTIISEDLVYENDDTLIADSNFASLLNADRVITIDSTVYKYVNEGVLIGCVKNIEDIESIDINSLYKYNIKHREIYPISETVSFIGLNNFPLKELQNSNQNTSTMYKVGDNIQFNIDDIKFISYDHSESEANDFQKWLSGLFGTNVVVNNNFDNTHRMRVRLFSQDYLIYSSIGMSVRFQKKFLGIWWRTKADEFRYGWQNIEIQTKYKEAFIPKVTIRDTTPPIQTYPEAIKGPFLYSKDDLILYYISNDKYDTSCKNVIDLYAKSIGSIKGTINKFLNSFPQFAESKAGIYVPYDESRTVRYLIPWGETVAYDKGRDIVTWDYQWFSGYVTFGLSYNFDSASWISSNVKATKAYEQIITRGEVYAYVRYNNQVKACVITTNELK